VGFEGPVPVGVDLGTQKPGGDGGDATATSGDGGDGSPTFPDGAAGGGAQAFGGLGGAGYRTRGGDGGDGTAAGGNGGAGAGFCQQVVEVVLDGEISVESDPASSDQYIFNAGSGTGLQLRLRYAGDPGGNGGKGGLLRGWAGQGGPRTNTPSELGLNGHVTLGAGANGGKGGDGDPGGTGGEAGSGEAYVVKPDEDLEANPVQPGLVQTVFTKGEDGRDCSSLGAPPRAPGVAATTETISILGSAPWVDVTGTLDTGTGAVSAQGRGTVAGFPNILVEFEGTWDADAQTLTGTYTIDSEKVIDPDHPIVYAVDVSGG
jgi:hypothetical protein